MQRVLTITLNPAIDVSTGAAVVVSERKLRCEPPIIQAGGGGVNVSRVIAELGGAATALVAIAGETGGVLRSLLAGAAVETEFIEADGATRISFAVHDRSRGEQFRFVLPGPEQSGGFAKTVIERLGLLLARDTYPYVVASGSLPPGLPVDFYATIAATVRDGGSRLILDTSGPPLYAGLGPGVFLVKPDEEEARALAATMGVEEYEPESLATAILDSGGAENVIITLGPDGALLASHDRMLRIRPPKVEVVSAVGAGDSFVGALTHMLVNGSPLETATAYGVAAAAAAVTTDASELAYRGDVERLFAAILQEADLSGQDG